MAWQESASLAVTAPGSAAPVSEPWAPPQRVRASARVGALEQVVPGWQVEAAQAPFDPLAVVERDAPDEVLSAGEARRVPASGQEQEVLPSHGSGVGGLGSARWSPERPPCGPPSTRGRSDSRRPIFKDLIFDRVRTKNFDRQSLRRASTFGEVSLTA